MGLSAVWGPVVWSVCEPVQGIIAGAWSSWMLVV